MSIQKVREAFYVNIRSKQLAQLRLAFRQEVAMSMARQSDTLSDDRFRELMENAIERGLKGDIRELTRLENDPNLTENKISLPTSSSSIGILTTLTSQRVISDETSSQIMESEDISSTYLQRRNVGCFLLGILEQEISMKNQLNDIDDSVRNSLAVMLSRFLDCMLRWPIREMVPASCQTTTVEIAIGKVLRVITVLLQRDGLANYAALREAGIHVQLVKLIHQRQQALTAQILDTVLSWTTVERQHKAQAPQEDVDQFISSENQHFIVLASQLLGNRDVRYYLKAVQVVINILEFNEYLADSVQIEVVKNLVFQINYLAANINNSINLANQIESVQANGSPAQNELELVKIAELLNDLVYSSPSLGVELLRNNSITECMHSLLRFLIHHPQLKSHQTLLSKLACIVCNLALVKDKSLKKIFLDHPIWEQIFGHLYEGSSVLELLRCCEYFFKVAGRKICWRVLQTYLMSVGELSFVQSPCSAVQIRLRQFVKDTIIFLNREACQHWPDGDEENLQAAIERSHLSQLSDE